MKIPIGVNERNTYTCKDCGEKFRLKMALNNHKCMDKDKYEKEDK